MDGWWRTKRLKGREILVASFLVVKVLVLFLLWANFDLAREVSSPSQVYAEEEKEQTQTAGEAGVRGSDNPDDLLASIRKEREALQRREERVRQREEALREKEARLEKIQNEIGEKLETLSQIQTSLETLIQEKKGLENDILKKLARVYESTPPEQAGPMLERLDVKLAAQILIRMDGRKAGKIWGFVSPERASQISSEITRIQ